jgi:hypothetical protein
MKLIDSCLYQIHNKVLYRIYNNDLSNKVSKGVVLTDKGEVISAGLQFTLSDSVDNYDYIIIEAYANVRVGHTRKFSTADFYASIDKGQATRFICLGHYYDPSYYASIGLYVNSDGKHITVGEMSIVGYANLSGIKVVGVNF